MSNDHDIPSPGARVLNRRPPALDRLLARLPERSLEHHWEGEFTGTQGAATGSVLRIKATIAFHGGMIAGAGRCVNLPVDQITGGDGVTFTGSVDAAGATDAVLFDIWFDADPIRAEAVRCNGQFGNEGRSLSGDWHIACFSGESCNCGGAGGTFELRRVD